MRFSTRRSGLNHVKSSARFVRGVSGSRGILESRTILCCAKYKAGRAMRRWLPIAIAVTGSLALGGCFESKPDMASFQTNLGRAISSRTGGDMKLVSVAEIDGSSDDPQHYTVFYNAVVQLNRDVTWCTFFAIRDLGTKEPGCHDGKGGDRVIISAIASFEKRESGWALVCTESYTNAGTHECFF
jgi:hypothetical protein